MRNVKHNFIIGEVVSSRRVLYLTYKKYKTKRGWEELKVWTVSCMNCGLITETNTHRILTKEHKSCMRCNHLPQGESGLNNLLLQYCNNAKKKNYNFTLTKNEFRNITSSNCHYCGCPPTKEIIGYRKVMDQKLSWGTYKWNGIDRIDNSKGYEINNCVPCCHNCNRAKSNMTYLQFTEWLNRIVLFRR